MDKKNYSNTIGLQVESLFELAPVQAEKCFDESKLLSLLSKEEYAGLKRIIVTGCGDSYSAAGVMAPSVSKLAGVSCASPAMIASRSGSPARNSAGMKGL